ncbi:cohesin domain-containing protein [bacterium]|nr:cohesin domain-containing protein [bacterium]
MKSHKFIALFLGAILIGLIATPLGAVAAQAESIVQGGFFETIAVQPGGQVEAPVEIRDVADLYAVDLEIQFDPEVVQIEDANPDMEGVQPALGTFLEAGLALYSSVDNDAGVVRFAMTQVNPAEAKSGSGVVLVLYLVGQSEGESPLTVTKLELATREGEGIPVEAVDGRVSVSADAPESAAMTIPVQEQDALVEIPTVIPSITPTPTATMASQPTQMPEDSVLSDDPDASRDQEEVDVASTQAETSVEGFSILDNWWVVLIVVVAAVVFGVYLLVSKK